MGPSWNGDKMSVMQSFKDAMLRGFVPRQAPRLRQACIMQ